jgi:acyl carrier protein
MPETAPTPGASELEERVLGVVRELAGELGGSRAQRAVAPGASLERDVGLGSLERVELMLRLERALGRRLDDDALSIDTPAELARAFQSAQAEAPVRSAPRPEVPSAAAPLEAPVGTVHEALWRRATADPDRPQDHSRRPAGGHRCAIVSPWRTSPRPT